MMRCLKIAEIYAYLDRELSLPRQAEVENHLALCPKCEQAVQERKLIGEAASKLSDLELPADFSQRVMARIWRQESSLPVWLAAIIIGLSSLGILSLLLLLSGGKTAFALLAEFHRFFVAYFKNATVVVAKLLTLLASAGKIIYLLGRTVAKCFSLLTTLISPSVLAILTILTVITLVSLYLGLKKKLLLGEKT